MITGGVCTSTTGPPAGDMHHSAITKGVAGTPLKLSFGDLGSLEVSDLPSSCSCRVSKPVVKYAGNQVPHCFHYPRGCGHDALRAVVERVFRVRRQDGVLVPPPVATGSFDELTGNVLSTFCPRAPALPATVEEVPLLMNGAKQKVYARAVASLDERKVCPRDAHLSSFVKIEASDYTKKVDPVGRLIQPRRPRYNVHLARFFKPHEHRMLRMVDEWNWDRPTKTPVIMKGLDAVGRGKTIVTKFAGFTDGRGVMTDATRFDQHVGVAAVDWEHAMYLNYFSGASTADKVELEELLSWQKHNKGYINCPDGTFIKYDRVAGRMSGDMNTSLGNCLIMSGLLFGLCKKLGIRAEVACDGDDAVTIMESTDVPRFVGALEAHFLSGGFTVQLEGIAECVEEVDFCQSRPVFNGETYVMCRNPLKALSNDMQGTGKWALPRYRDELLSAVGQGGGHLCVGLPIMQQFYTNMRSVPVADISKWETQSGLKYAAKQIMVRYNRDFSRVPVRPVSSAARLSFNRAYGIPPDRQVSIERSLPFPKTGAFCREPADIERLRVMKCLHFEYIFS